MRSDCIQKGKCTKNCLAAGLRSDPLGELTVPPDPPLHNCIYKRAGQWGREGGWAG